MELELKLNKKISTHDGETKVLKFREPTGGDVMRLGFPYEVQGNGEFKVREEIALKYVDALCNDLDDILVEQMAPADLFAAMWHVVGLCAPDAEPDGEAAAAGNVKQ